MKFEKLRTIDVSRRTKSQRAESLAKVSLRHGAHQLGLEELTNVERGREAGRASHMEAVVQVAGEPGGAGVI